MYIVSACLAGVNCKYNGGHNADPRIKKLIEEGKAIPICPEQLGGLTTPRRPAEIKGGTGSDVLIGKARVIDADGLDVTEAFVKGAQEVLKLARLAKANKAILKAKSPSCGCGFIYDGSFSGKLIEGNGVTAQILIDNGIEIEP
ncbi:MAG: hypothetical protein PWP48_1928 [Clostridiales bacterium]|jgi:uncharacterized protein YbbK (DUF523 family)|nr:hypothetical protein [Clostridiales bacterium]MDK2992695.1 hypothetical protein [Clostridiales bacterium]